MLSIGGTGAGLEAVARWGSASGIAGRGTSCSGRTRQFPRFPEAVLLDGDVGEDDQLAHHSGQSHLLRVAPGLEVQVLPSQLGMMAGATRAGMQRRRRRRRRPPWIQLVPRQTPDSFVTGARPARLPAVLAVSVPSSGMCTRSSAAVMWEMPGIDIRISARRASSASSATSLWISASQAADVTFELPYPVAG